MMRRQCHDLLTLVSEEYIVANKESVCTLANKGLPLWTDIGVGGIQKNGDHAG